MSSESLGTSPAAPRPVPPGAGRGALLASMSSGLGGLGLLLSVVFIGAIPSLAGLLLGFAAWTRRGVTASTRAAVWTGLWLSTFGIVASLAFFAAYRSGRHPLQFLMTTVSQPASPRPDPWHEWVGQPMPEVEWSDLDGTQRRLSEWRGRRVILDLWATWCPPCVREIPHFQQLASESTDGDLVVIGITSETASVVRPFTRAQGIRYPIGLADYMKWPEPFPQVAGLPTTFFIDREGILRSVALGYHDLGELRRRAAELGPVARAHSGAGAP